MLKEYELTNGVPLTNKIFVDWAHEETTLNAFSEANTYKLSDYLVNPRLGQELDEMKLICDINFLIEVTDNPDLAPDDLDDDDRWYFTFHYRDGDYILYSQEYYVFLIRDNIAYQIGYGSGCEPLIHPTKESRLTNYASQWLINFEEECPIIVS